MVTMLPGEAACLWELGDDDGVRWGRREKLRVRPEDEGPWGGGDGKKRKKKVRISTRQVVCVCSHVLRQHSVHIKFTRWGTKSFKIKTSIQIESVNLFSPFNHITDHKWRQEALKSPADKNYKEEHLNSPISLKKSNLYWENIYYWKKLKKVVNMYQYFQPEVKLCSEGKKKCETLKAAS